MNRHSGKTVLGHSGETVRKENEMKHVELNLTLFEGEGAGADGGSAVASAEADVMKVEAKTEEGGNGMESVGEDLKNPAEKEKTPEERLEEYNRFKADYKDLYGKDVQNAIGRRYKENEQLRQQIDAYGPLLNTLSAKYGLENPDVQMLMEAIDKDNSFWEEAAIKEGMSVEQYKKMKQYEAEHKQILDAARKAEQIRQKEQTWERWNQEAELCAQKFPQFNMDAELNNDNFIRLLGAGLDVESAYKAAHFDELTEGIAKQTEQETRKKVADNIRAGAGRPLENGIGTGGANKTKTSAWDLSQDEFRQYLERCKSGEQIQTFGA